MPASESHPRENPAPHRLSGTATWLLGRAAQRAQQVTQDVHGMRKWHYAVLLTISEYGPAAQAEIGRRLGVDRSDMVAILNDLEGDGYVIRAPDPADRRRNSVELTPEGQVALSRFDRLVAKADDTLLQSLSAAEREQLIALLSRIVLPERESSRTG